MPDYYGSLINFLNCSWQTAVCAFWVKYPNRYSDHVLSEDTLDRRISNDGNMYTRRLLIKTNSLPSWGSAVFRSHLARVVCIVEESVVNPVDQIMKIYTWNTSYTNMMDVQERVTITPSGSDETKIFKEGWVDSSLIGFRKVLKKFGSTRWKNNAKKAFAGYQDVVNDKFKFGHVNSDIKINIIKDVKDKAKIKALKMAVRTQIQS